MNSARFCLLAATLFCLVGEPLSAHSQENPVEIAAVPGNDAPSKLENGFQIFWRSTWVPGNPQPGATDPEARIRIFEDAHQLLVVCRVATAIRSFDPTFTGVSIYDVSARQPGFIAGAWHLGAIDQSLRFVAKEPLIHSALENLQEKRTCATRTPHR